MRLVFDSREDWPSPKMWSECRRPKTAAAPAVTRLCSTCTGLRHVKEGLARGGEEYQTLAGRTERDRRICSLPCCAETRNTTSLPIVSAASTGPQSAIIFDLMWEKTDNPKGWFSVIGLTRYVVNYTTVSPSATSTVTLLRIKREFICEVKLDWKVVNDFVANSCHIELSRWEKLDSRPNLTEWLRDNNLDFICFSLRPAHRHSFHWPIALTDERCNETEKAFWRSHTQIKFSYRTYRVRKTWPAVDVYFGPQKFRYRFSRGISMHAIYCRD